MNFHVGDRVLWKGERKWIGTVTEVNGKGLSVFWDDLQRVEINHADSHVIAKRCPKAMRNSDDFEVDA